jgi:hypothetical protein
MKRQNGQILVQDPNGHRRRLPLLQRCARQKLLTLSYMVSAAFGAGGSILAAPFCPSMIPLVTELSLPPSIVFLLS